MTCHTAASPSLSNLTTLALVGHPNVGKSLIFNWLTGRRVTVSNFPGTTVEVAAGPLRACPQVQVVDTPGIVTLPARSQEEMVTERLLLQERPLTLVQVGDAKNLRRTLLLTARLLAFGRPLVLVLNMLDEAAERGVTVNVAALAQRLGVPVVPTVAVKGAGLAQIVPALATATPPAVEVPYPQAVTEALEALAALFPPAGIAPRALGLLWLLDDPVVHAWLQERLSPPSLARLQAIREALEARLGQPAAEAILQAQLSWVAHLLAAVVTPAAPRRTLWRERLAAAMIHPLWGLPFLGLVLVGLYALVGVFGAGTLVDWLEGTLFGAWINPWVARLVAQWVPFPWLRDLLVGPYGLWTMGMTYALALILPIVLTFFLAFSLLEDSGYLPRLAVLTNQAFARIGLNGKAVVPMVLGLGCVTMATLSTRVLENRRERLLATLLLALAIPCSAQLGVVMGMLAAVSPVAVLIWAGVVLLVLFAVGFLAARLLPGDRTPLVMELPPLRLPVWRHVLIKTAARLEWYLKEVVPLFLLGAAALFTLDRLRVLSWLARLAEPVVTGWLGLPAETSTVFLMGFLRRDFGATGLFMMQSQGLLTPLQVVVAMVAITLFVPCIASALMIAKEHGRRVTAGILLTVFPLAFLVSGLLGRVLYWLGWS